LLSAIGLIVATLAPAGASAAAAAGGAEPGPRVTIAVLPNGTTVEQLDAYGGLAPGLLSAGLGNVPPTQTFFDVTQGNRVSQSLYEPVALPPLVPSAPGGVPPELWRIVSERAEDAPAEVVPGLLASTLIEAGVPVTVAPYQGGATLMGADREGRIDVRRGRCPTRGCPGVTITDAEPSQLPDLIKGLRGNDMLIAIERPPPDLRLLTFAIAGRGIDGLATSDSTRTRGLVTSTDVAPTILDRLGIDVPEEMNGRPIRGEGSDDIFEISELSERLEVTSLRRGPAIGQNLLAWLVLLSAACLVYGRRGARIGLLLLAVAGAYMPLMCLVGAALQPSLPAERLLVGVGAPLLGAITLRLHPGWRAMGIASLASVGAFAADLVAGTGLVPLSIPGPNPAAGSRFFGIGNEVEAIVAALLPIGVGALLASREETRNGGRTAALVFLGAGVAGAVVFAAGRFGADVGAAIVLPAAMAVGAAVALGSRRGTMLVLLAPIAGLVLLALVDVIAGGGAHLTSSVLEAGGLEEAGDVLERRLRLAGKSFERGDNVPYLGIAAILLGLFIWRRRTVLGWFRERAALAGFAGAAAAAVVGTVSNDSGAILLILIGAYLAVTAGYAWAVRAGEEPEGSHVTAGTMDAAG
jgi:hypothetical protein